MTTPIAQPSPLAMLTMASRGAFTVGLLAVTVLSLAPAEALPTVDLWDKLEHAMAYALLAATGCLGFGLAKPRPQLGVVLALSVFGGAIEVAQPLLSTRNGSLADAFANQIGITLGWMLAWSVCALLQRPRSA